MTIKFIGTGGAFDYRYRNSAAIVWLRDMKILIDCGCDIFTSLRQKEQADDITHVLITHLHDDHAGSLGSLLAYHVLILKKPPLKLIYPTDSFRDHLLAFMKFILKDPNKFAEFIPIADMEGVGFIDTYGKHVADFPTFSYYFTEDGQCICHSGDIGNPDFIFEELTRLGLEGATVFHDITFSETNKPHAFYRDVSKHLDGFSIYGYHLDPEKEPGDNLVTLVQKVPELLI